MKSAWLLTGIALLLFLASCGKPKFDDPNIEDQYYIYLEDEETQQIVSDQVLYTLYKNGTKLCGYAVVDDEDQCYKLLEGEFHAELQALKQVLVEEVARAEEYERQLNQSNSTETQPAPQSSQ